MTSPSIHQEILEELGKLEEDEKQQVLDLAKTLAKSKPKGTPGKILIQLAQGIQLEDLQKMSEAIEEGCEGIDVIEW